MNKKLQRVQHIIRKAGLLKPVEELRCLYSVAKYKSHNAAFIRQYPDFALPPSSLAYDAYSAPDWEYYHRSGLQMASDLVTVMQKHGVDTSGSKILEWGCGPGRIIRHLPNHVGPTAEVYGSDYNRDSISWASRSISGVKFVTNDLHPPLRFADKTFDAVYCNSVFTHLAEATCVEWINEINRVLKDGGVFFFTTHSDSYKDLLLPHEKRAYEQDGCYVRGDYTEGKKMFLAFQSPEYIKRQWLRGFQLLKHYLPGSFAYITAQDAWLVKKHPHN